MTKVKDDSPKDSAEGNLWETLLSKAGGTKPVSTKNVLLLGDANSGKSDIIVNLFQAAQTPHLGNGLGAAKKPSGIADITSAKPSELASHELAELAKVRNKNLALSYSFMDVRDEDNEDIIMRLGIYQLSSDTSSERELLHFVLSAKSVADTVAIVVLDWSRPWRFIRTLLRWLNILKEAINDVEKEVDSRHAGDNTKGPTTGWTHGKAMIDECREKCKYFAHPNIEALERFLQEYEEPVKTTAASVASDLISKSKISSTTKTDSSNNSKVANVLLSLGEGVLSENLAMPIIFVCTKSDYMDTLERERGFKEEDFDFIQRTLRSISLMYGASLIYTSTLYPETFSTLYHYIVHRHLSVPVVQDTDLEKTKNNDNANNADEEANQAPGNRASATSRTRYDFRIRANIVDRDRVVVPAGWDSMTKIRYLRDNFDVSLVQEAWKKDEERYQKYLHIEKEASNGNPFGDSHGEGGDERDGQSSLITLYSEVVLAPGQSASVSDAATAAAHAMMSGVVTAEDNHEFLKGLFEDQEERLKNNGEETASERDSKMRSNTVSKFMSGLKARNFADNVLTTAVDLQDEPPAASTAASSLGTPAAGATSTTSLTASSLLSRSQTIKTAAKSGPRARVSDTTETSLPASKKAEAHQDPKATTPVRNTSSSVRRSNTAAGGGAGNRNQELSTFFQNLLGKKSGGGGASTGASGSPRASTGIATPQTTASNGGNKN
ncbi:hypothetical protein H4219_003982 [Mycoemilia scoparia]|uniref:Dynein light intermediate chain n=1 Tax=Mycoemilia scoparia TaxID=417184 RepID=A0A9W8DRW0_9FUNG|nr:hypothetical protein H4219_003982 [Mycoemilia scoparia]